MAEVTSQVKKKKEKKISRVIFQAAMFEMSDLIRNWIMQSLFILILKKKKVFSPTLEACGFC